MEAYISILEALVGEGVEFAVIGTWALKVHFPEAMRDYPVHDCDLVIRPEEENVRVAVRALRSQGWKVTVWERELGPEFVIADLGGKFYLRSRKEELTVDLTFECPIPWYEMAAGIEWWNGLPLASVGDILDLKRRKAREAGTVEETEGFISGILSIGK
ncbi:MAG: hypothetical protein U0176_13195 [Bacteroidia bacterium]